jgi:predicted lysophospholipase L1 biosynthesis ABC-type transport system permease subunit
MGIPLLQGRAPGAQDTQNSLPVAVVSQSFVDQYLDLKAPPIGRTFEFAFRTRTIVGVVGNVRIRGLERQSEPQVYLPHRQVPDGWLTPFAPKDLVVHTADIPGTLAAARRIVASADPEQPVSLVRSMQEVIAADTEGRTTQLYVLGLFAGTAVLLAAVGIHGLLAFAVSQRRQEIGVRLALGARPATILRLIVNEGAILGAAGLVLGITAGFFAGRLLESLLAGISPFDPLAFGATALLCGVLALVGSLGPALRAIRVDPAESIRAE